MPIEVMPMPPQGEPQWRVTETYEDDIGRDLGWFFSVKEAREYQQFIETKRRKQKRKRT